MVSYERCRCSNADRLRADDDEPRNLTPTTSKSRSTASPGALRRLSQLIPLPAILAVFKVEEWDNFGLFTVDPAHLLIIDVLLGGRRGQTAIRIEGPTTIETSLVKRMIEIVVDAE